MYSGQQQPVRRFARVGPAWNPAPVFV